MAMKILKFRLVSLIAALVIFQFGLCNESQSNTTTEYVYNVWQNPFLSPNPTNNVHCDSYLTDSYDFAGPTFDLPPLVRQADFSFIKDPDTGKFRPVVLGECASQAFDAQGNIQSVCAGLAGPGATSVERSVVTIDRNTMEILAFYPFQKPVENTGKVDFGGAGYFYQDAQYRMVVALPNGHVQILRRTPSAAGGVDGYTVDADYNITGTNGAVPIPNGVDALSLYALVPDKNGNIWFTIAEGIVGTITPDGTIHWMNLNDPENTGQQQPQDDGGFEAIANSHCVDEGDSDSGPSGAYIVTTYRLYRMGAAADGTPVIDWSVNYDHGIQIKSGQVSFGSGTSPTAFRIGNRRFVTIADNAKYMNVNVYRAEINLLPGEDRLFAQAAPFGQNEAVSDENSLIVAPCADLNSVDIYAENNFGNDDVNSTLDAAVTQPGFARMHLDSSGTFTVASINNTIAVPSLVSKISLGSNTVYTYNKTPNGWYLTGLDAKDLTKVLFTTQIGSGTLAYNNFYAALSLDPDGKTIWLGTLFGLTRIRQVECTATLDDKLSLNIPCLATADGTLLRANFVYSYKPSYPFLVPFKLTDAAVIDDPSCTCAASTLSNDLSIHIPDVVLPDEATHFWLDLAFDPVLSTDGDFYWVVSDYGAGCSPQNP